MRSDSTSSHAAGEMLEGSWALSRFRIRPVCAGDAGQLARRCFPAMAVEEVEDQVRDDLAARQSGRGLTLVAEAAGTIAATMKMTLSGRDAWIHNVVVHSRFRGQGMAKRMLEEMAGHCARAGAGRILLHVRRDNLPAIHAYEKAGFRFLRVDGMRGDQLCYGRDL